MDNILYTGKKTMSKIVNGENMGMERSDVLGPITFVHVRNYQSRNGDVLIHRRYKSFQMYIPAFRLRRTTNRYTCTTRMV
jgi:hypothetical protein